MMVQIYEVSEPREAKQLAEAGVDHIGALVGNGAYPREISHAQAKAVFESLPSGASSVALTLSRDPEEILALVDSTGPDILHIGTLPEHFPPQKVASLKRQLPGTKIMRSIPVRGAEAVSLAQRFAPTADLLLLDSFAAGDTQIGATGEVHNWSLSRRIVQALEIPVILAGGLGPDNVVRAIAEVRPDGVDSKTKTDRPGTHRKDLKRVQEFVRAARSCF